MFGSSRSGGVRGGQDQFNWADVKVDKHRENYLGKYKQLIARGNAKGCQANSCLVPHRKAFKKITPGLYFTTFFSIIPFVVASLITQCLGLNDAIPVVLTAECTFHRCLWTDSLRYLSPAQCCQHVSMPNKRESYVKGHHNCDIIIWKHNKPPLTTVWPKYFNKDVI